jgi:hypothetical protein
MFMQNLSSLAYTQTELVIFRQWKLSSVYLGGLRCFSKKNSEFVSETLMLMRNIETSKIKYADADLCVN